MLFNVLRQKRLDEYIFPVTTKRSKTDSKYNIYYKKSILYL